MSDSEDASPENKAHCESQNVPQVLEIPSSKDEHDLRTPEAKSDDSIASEAPTREPEFEMLNPGDFEDGENAALTKSGTSSLGSFTEVESLPHSPGVEMTMEHSDMTKLLHEAGRESGESSNETEERTPPPEFDNGKECDEASVDLEEKDTSLNNEKCNEMQDLQSETLTVTEKEPDVSDENVKPGHELSGDLPEQLEPSSVSTQNVDSTDGGKAAVDSDTLSDFSKVSQDSDATLFSSITYLGSSTVNAPVSDTELKRTMAILKQQSRVAMNIILSVGSSFKAEVKLLDPENRTVIATYQLQKILFCGRGDDDGNEADCFAFNICHSRNDIFLCHVFRCLESAAVSEPSWHVDN
jgi:hypothetical protein